MPEITLSTLSLILGAGALGGGVWGLTQEATVRELLKGYPRNNNVGYATILAGMVWFLYILGGESMSDFEQFRTIFNVLLIGTGVGACVYLKDYLAVRGTAVLMILVAKLIVDTARWHDSEWRLVLVVMAYIMVIKGMWLTVSPWKMRDLIQWILSGDKRFKNVCIARIVFGALLLGLGLAVF